MGNRIQIYSARYDALHEENYKIQEHMLDPISFLAKIDEDKMYYHQSMKQEDA